MTLAREPCLFFIIIFHFLLFHPYLHIFFLHSRIIRVWRTLRAFFSYTEQDFIRSIYRFFFLSFRKSWRIWYSIRCTFSLHFVCTFTHHKRLIDKSIFPLSSAIRFSIILQNRLSIISSGTVGNKLIGNLLQIRLIREICVEKFAWKWLINGFDTPCNCYGIVIRMKNISAR